VTGSNWKSCGLRARCLLISLIASHSKISRAAFALLFSGSKYLFLFSLSTEKADQHPVFIKEEKDVPEYCNNSTRLQEEPHEEPSPKRPDHVHDIYRSRKDHLIKETDRSSMPLPWNQPFRDPDDFDYTLKLLRKSLGESAITRRPPPRPVEVLCKVFPTHKQNILELVLKGCSGDIVQAIECILAGKNNSIGSPSSSSPGLPNDHALGHPSHQSISFAGMKPTLLNSMPSLISFTPFNRISKTTPNPLTSTGVAIGHKHGESRRFSPYHRNSSVQTCRVGNEEAEFGRYNSNSNGFFNADVMSSVSASPHSPDDSCSTRDKVSVCFQCGTKPRSGDRFCGKCGADFKS